MELSRLWLTKPWQRWVAVLCTFAGLVTQTAYMFGRSSQSNLPPLLSSSHDWLLVSVWLIVAIYLAYWLKVVKRKGYEFLGLFVLPVAIILVVAAAFMDDVPNQVTKITQAKRFWTMLHAGSLSLGITGVLIGFLISMMYLIQHRRLKKKRQLRPGFSLPPLTSLAQYNYRAIMMSFPMLTIGLFTGVILGLSSPTAKAVFSWKDPVEMVFIVVWTAMFFLFIWLAKRKTGHGRQVAMLTAWAFSFLIITLLVLISLTGIQPHNG